MKMFLGLSLFFFALSVQAQQYSSYHVCKANVPCYGRDYYGRTVVIGQRSCITYGSTYVNGGGSSQNACTWQAQMGVGVVCSGYAQVTDAYGNVFWGWNTFRSMCPGY